MSVDKTKEINVDTEIKILIVDFGNEGGVFPFSWTVTIDGEEIATNVEATKGEAMRAAIEFIKDNAAE